ncbi:hypothetical protein NST32_05265 [Bacillus sp. FSL L8-0215]|uniref:hypothetical protein n=1 Tax=Bacillus sp. FSL L8-0215 TaxID=2954617 RepID=UPI00315909DD
MNINYPSGYGPDNSLELDVKKVVVVDIPPGYRGAIDTFFNTSESAWECVTCINSLHSGSKVMQFGNHGRSNTGVWSLYNESASTLSFLISCWHKKSTPNENEPWWQTGNIKSGYRIDRMGDWNIYYSIYEFNGYGELAGSPYIDTEVEFSYTKVQK